MFLRGIFPSALFCGPTLAPVSIGLSEPFWTATLLGENPLQTYLSPSIPEGFCVQKVQLCTVRAGEGRADGLKLSVETPIPPSYPLLLFFFMDLYRMCCLCVSGTRCSLVLYSPAIWSGPAVLQATSIAAGLALSFVRRHDARARCNLSWLKRWITAAQRDCNLHKDCVWPRLDTWRFPCCVLVPFLLSAAAQFYPFARGRCL